MKYLPRLLYRLNRLRWFILRPVTLGVRLIMIRDEQALLVKHTYQRHWYLPGGGVKRSETLDEAIRREAAEEVGATLRDLTLFGNYSNFFDYKNDHVIVFLSRDFSLTGKSDGEIEAVKFFPLTRLPDQISPGSRRRLNELQSNGQTPIVSRW